MFFHQAATYSRKIWVFATSYLAFSLPTLYNNLLDLNPFLPVSVMFYFSLECFFFPCTVFSLVLFLLFFSLSFKMAFLPFTILHTLLLFRTSDKCLVTSSFVLFFLVKKVQKTTCLIKGHSTWLHSLVFQSKLIYSVPTKFKVRKTAADDFPITYDTKMITFSLMLMLLDSIKLIWIIGINY